MKGKPRSLRQAQALQTIQLRSQGRTWAEIAAVFGVTYRVNPRVALRQAHGWSQPQAAARWTERWPDDPKTFKNFSYWEQWPGQTGHAPSLDTLDRLAQLYECKLTDLLTDCRDYGARVGQAAGLRVRERPQPAEAGSRFGRLGADRPGAERVGAAPVRGVIPLGGVIPVGAWQEPDGPDGPERPEGDGHSYGGTEQDGAEPYAAEPGTADAPAIPAVSASELQSAIEMIRRAGTAGAGHLSGAADGPEFRLRRRTLLLEASSALAVLAAAPVFEVPRIVGGTRSGPTHTDLAIVGYTAEVVAGLRRLGGAVGPRITLQPAMALRSAMAAFARNVPEIVNAEALTAYGDLTQLIGWLMFNLGDHKAAAYYYDDARAAAYRAGNDDLVSYTLAATSHLAAARRQPRFAIDHAQAAAQAARASGNPYAVAYASDVTARAYAAARQVGRCQAALDREQEALTLITPDAPRSPWWYFYDRSFYWGTESECALRLGWAVDASDAAGRSLHLVTPTNLHNSALTLAFRAEALIKQGEYAEACVTLADSARLTTLNSSRRIARRIDSLRKQLAVVQDTADVRELDEKLAEYRRARAVAKSASAAPAGMA